MNKEIINGEFADYETATMLQELRFDEEVMGYHLNKVDGVYVTAYEKVEQYRSVKAPLWRQVKKWLYEKHQIEIYPSGRFEAKQYRYRVYNKDIFLFEGEERYDSIITAEIEAIKQAVKHIQYRYSL